MKKLSNLRFAVFFAGLYFMGTPLFTQDINTANNLLSKGYENLTETEVDTLHTYYDSVLSKQPFDINANIGLMRIFAENGSMCSAENLLSRVWILLDEKQILNSLKIIISNYSCYGDYEKALFWINIFCQIDQDKSMEQFSSEKLKEVINLKMKYQEILSSRDFNFLRNKSFIDGAHFYAFIDSIIPVNMKNANGIFSVDKARISFALSMINKWDVLGDIIVIDGYQAHNATVKILVLYNMKSNSGVIYYWNVYNDMYIITKNIQEINQPEFVINYQKWFNRISSEYQKNNGTNLIRNKISIYD